MPRIVATLDSPVRRTFRVEQVAGCFDVQLAQRSRLELSAHVPPGPPGAEWRIGVIVGPSGSGKSAIARAAYGPRFIEPATSAGWPADQAVVDGFPADLGIEQITGALAAVGFSSPPAWVLPYGALSTGQRMRADLARALLCPGSVIAFDEFTSVVDRQVGRFASAAVQRAVRKRQVPVERFVAVTCHYDVIDWLEPDWVLDLGAAGGRTLIVAPGMDAGVFRGLPRGCLQRRRRRWSRPGIEIEVCVCSAANIWPLFEAHHYLSGAIHRASRGYAAVWDGRPVGLCATLADMGHAGRRRVHRLVVLPDYQGMGIGLRLLDAAAELELAAGARAVGIVTSHPALIAALRRGGRSGRWRQSARRAGGTLHSGMSRSQGRRVGSINRATTSFAYLATSR